MNYAIDNLINVCFISFAFTMAIEFLSGLRQLWINSATKTEAKDIVLNGTLSHEPETFTTLVSEDFWLMPLVAPIEAVKPCCCSAIAPPQLLLAAGMGGTKLPDLASLPSIQLRRMCSEAGIKWRNTNGSKHLSKGEMIASLTS